MTGRTVLVTGGGSGIGLSVARRFAREGARVAILDQDAELGRQAADSVAGEGGECASFRADVSREADVSAGVVWAAERFGGIDHVVNNAGIVFVKPFEESTAEDWDQVMNVNAKSMFLVARHALPWLRRSQRATIVNLGSISSFAAQRDTPIYVVSKAAVVMLTKALALALAADGIRVNCVCPGVTDTPMIRRHLSHSPDPEAKARERVSLVPMGRMMQPEEIAAAVFFLSTPESSGMTGASLLVDGGKLAAVEWSSQ